MFTWMLVRVTMFTMFTWRLVTDQWSGPMRMCTWRLVRVTIALPGLLGTSRMPPRSEGEGCSDRLFLRRKNMSGMQKIGWDLIKDYFLEWESKSETKSLKVNSDKWKQCKVENKSQELTFIGTLTCHPYLWVKSQHPGSIFVECKLRVRSWLPPDSVPTSYQFMTPSETRVTESVC